MDAQSPKSYLHSDRRIIQYIAAFGMPPIRYDPTTDKLICPANFCRWTLAVVTIYAIGAFILFYRVQYAILLDGVTVSRLSDTFRGLSTAYAYQILILVAVMNRRLYANFFNDLSEIDCRIWRRFGVKSDYAVVRRHFWCHTWVWSLNYVLVSFPIALHFYASRSFGDVMLMVSYVLSALGLGVCTVFVQYAAHTCLVRFVCLRGQLLKSLYGEGNLCDFRATLRLLDDMDIVKEALHDSFGTLLTWKLAIDGVNVIASLYFLCFRLLNSTFWRGVKSFLDYAFFEFPFILANILMVGYYQGIGDEVSVQ